ncbi:MAG: hypothetical protein MPN21_00930 [Thermoanaerobaculia bacterium]|nr:hypothetical protein [Thermoanaerobaculia bacterium]
MRRRLIIALVLVWAGSSASHATLIPTEQLEQFFIDHGVEYFTVADFQGNGGSGDYLFLPTRDPKDHETIGIFFELNTGNSLNDPAMHWAIGLRGPRPGAPLPDHYGGRGLALGHLGAFDNCTDVGAFIEDFTNAELGANHQLTLCQNLPLLTNYNTYRIDIHVSKLNVYIQIWKKQYLPYVGWHYQKIGDYGCNQGFCPENLIDKNFGGVFLGSASLGAGYTWTASDIHVAFF